MSIAVVKGLSLMAVGAAGAAYAVNKVYQPSKAQSIAGQMRLQLDQQNSEVHPEWDQSGTVMDRYALMNANKEKKPWNKTYAEHERTRDFGLRRPVHK